MPDEPIINPWLTEQIRLYKAAHADAELREAYYRLRETEPDRTWFGFLIDSSVQAAIRENPFLGRKFIDTDLPLLMEAFSYYEKHAGEYRERLFWMSHTIARAYDMLGDYEKRREYMDLAEKYDDDPIE